jgi:hypothetical protein
MGSRGRGIGIWVALLIALGGVAGLGCDAPSRRSEPAAGWPSVGRATPAVRWRPPTPPPLTVAGRSAPLALDGAVGINVRLALDANGGALREVTIRPGDTWSFNAAIGDPRTIPVRTVAGVPGGGWCDLASRYVQALRPVLPPEAFAFPNHVRTAGVGLVHVADEDAVAIWNIDGQPGSFGGRQDLEVTNLRPYPVRLRVRPHVLPDGRAAIVVEALTPPAP